MDESGKVLIHNIELRERVIGAGRPVLLIHGWGANIDLLAPLALRLNKKGYRCYMFDLPGFGDSEEPPAPFTVRDYADVCLAYLDKHQLGEVDFFGHSLGGRIGLMLGSDFAERLRAIVLSNSAGVKPKTPIQAALRLRAYRAIRGGLGALGARTAADGLQRRYAQRYGSVDYQNASPIMRRTLSNIVNQDLLAYARRVTAPTVLIWGAEDQETPLWMGKKLEATIPDAALIVHEGAGHYAYLDAPDKTVEIMRALYRGS